MITKIFIDGFKSFQDFELEFAPLTVIAGVNASGKSNLFDALTLLSKLAEVDNIKKAFKEQRGEFTEMFTQIDENEYADKMEFKVEMLVNKKVKDAWGNEATLKYTRLRYHVVIQRTTNSSGIEDLIVVKESLEKIKHNDDKWVKRIPKEVRDTWRPQVKTGKRGASYMETEIENGIPTVIVPQDGTQGNRRRFPLNNSSRTVLSSFDTIDFPHVLAVKEEMKSWKFLQLNPAELRKPTSKETGEDTIDSSGRNLAAALYRIKQEDTYNLIEISRKLQKFLPEFIRIDVEDDKENKQFIIKLETQDHKKYSSRVLSEGTLRIMTLCILDFDNKHTGLLCFEEPENGVHHKKIKDMAALLGDLSTNFIDNNLPLRQVIINTHSSALLNMSNRIENNNKPIIYYAEMQNRIIDLANKRRKIKITNMKLVEDKDMLLFDEMNEQEQKISRALAKEYLEISTI